MSEPAQPATPEQAQLKDALTAAAKLIEGLEQKKVEFTNFATDQTAEIAKLKDLLNADIQSFRTEKQAVESVRAEVEAIRAEISASRTAASNDVNEISKTRKQFDELAVKATTSQSQLSQHQADLEERLEDIEAVVASFGKERDTLLKITGEIAEAKSAVEQNKTSVASDTVAVTDAKNLFDQLAVQTKSAHETVTTRKDQVLTSIDELDTAIKNLSVERDTLSEIVGEVRKIKDNAEAGKTAALQDVQSIAEVKQKFDLQKAETQSALDDLTTRRGQAVEKIAEIDSTYECCTNLGTCAASTTDNARRVRGCTLPSPPRGWGEDSITHAARR